MRTFNVTWTDTDTDEQRTTRVDTANGGAAEASICKVIAASELGSFNHDHRVRIDHSQEI
jgi:hypothetical protein